MRLCTAMLAISACAPLTLPLQPPPDAPAWRQEAPSTEPEEDAAPMTDAGAAVDAAPETAGPPPDVAAGSVMPDAPRSDATPATDVATAMTDAPGTCSSPAHCPARPFSGAVCVWGHCGIACIPGRASCDDDNDNGCEADLRFDPGACGACGRVCGPREVCSEGACAARCDQWLMLCNGRCVDPERTPTDCAHCSDRCARGQRCVDARCV